MQPTPIALRLGTFFARINPAELGHGPFGWYPVHFDQRDASNPQSRFTLSQPDGERFLIRHDQSQAALGADATENSGDIHGQFYGKPNVGDGDYGGFEAWYGWTLGNSGIDIVLVQYDRDDGRYTSADLTVVEL